MDDYLEREIELNQIHEDILARREVLLRHSEWHLGSLEKKKKSAADELILANARNQSLIEDVKRVETELRRNAVKGNSPKLQALKALNANGDACSQTSDFGAGLSGQGTRCASSLLSACQGLSCGTRLRNLPLSPGSAVGFDSFLADPRVSLERTDTVMRRTIEHALTHIFKLKGDSSLASDTAGTSAVPQSLPSVTTW
uniref:Uncharacterized protein LOC100373662 n=1 Tax=Saccoglossus kowalevskii TaxID=10224 RepID=A0ABM0GNN6_SACKO|nr:PREDICTED: uncharacterized protein LOC100373662 [Saccoglossus kowalevskii]